MTGGGAQAPLLFLRAAHVLHRRVRGARPHPPKVSGPRDLYRRRAPEPRRRNRVRRPLERAAIRLVLRASDRIRSIRFPE